MKPSVLITRPRDEAEAFAVGVAAIGYTPVIEPLLSVELLPLQDDATAQALVVTSPQVFKHNLPESWRHLPLFVMGPASKLLAQSQGFTEIISADGDFTRLCSLVSEKIAAKQPVLYLRGETVRHDLKAVLLRHNVREQIAYTTEPCQKISLEGFKNGTIQIVTLFSPRSAVLFKDLMIEAGIADELRGIKLLCLSAAVLESVKSLPWEQVRLAHSPDQQGMLDALQGWV
jgi:uroporphyrinogen-III synthase